MLKIFTYEFNMTEKTGYLIDLISVFTLKELKVRYKSSILGYLWSIANPLLFAMIYYFIFKLVMRVQIPNYTLFLITGLFPWQWFNNAVNNSLFSFLANAQIVKKTVFPRSIIPFCNTFMEFLHFLCTIPVIVIFLYVYGLSPSWVWIWGVPIIALAQMMFIYGLSLMFSALNLFFRDLERFVSLALVLMFYCTPILYSIDLIPPQYHGMISLNPMAEVILAWRDLFMNGVLDVERIISMYIFSIFTLIIGSFVFNKLKYRFAEIL